MDRKRLGSFVLGGLTGLIAGVLLAPKSGRETRGTIVDRAGEARQRGSESYFDARERFSERISSTREKAPPGPHVAGSGHPERPVPDPGTPPPPRPVLRDVSRDAPESEIHDVTDSPDRSEALRRKVRETRDKLRDLSSKDAEEKPPGSAPGETERE